MNTPPHDLDAERSIVGSLLIQPSLAVMACAGLKVDDFYLPAHRALFEAIALLTKAEKPCDPIAIWDAAKSRGSVEGSMPDGVSGVDYLMECMSSTPTAEAFDSHMEIVKSKSTLRSLISLCVETQSRALGGCETAADLLSSLAQQTSVLATGQSYKMTSAGDLMLDVLEAMERRAKANAESRNLGVRFGVVALDQVLGGLRPGNLCVVAAETAGGKTALAMQAALSLCLDDGGTALACNLEMTSTELAERLLVRRSQVNSASVRDGTVEYTDYKKMLTYAGGFSDVPLYLQDHVYSMRDIESRAVAWRARHPGLMGLLVVDFIQLIQAAGRRSGTRAEEVGQHAQHCKRLAKQLGVPVILISQFNRNSGQDGREPTKADLKESGDIEQAADQIILIHNRDQTEDGQVRLILDKNRHGPCRSVEAYWTGRYYKFTDE